MLERWWASMRVPTATVTPDTTSMKTEKRVPRRSSLFEPQIAGPASRDALRKLDPRRMARNPVMFVVEVGSLITTFLFLKALVTNQHNLAFLGQLSAWLWFTVLFANFAEAMAEGRGKA